MVITQEHIEKVTASLANKKAKITERKNNIIKAKSEKEFQTKRLSELEDDLRELGVTDFTEEGIQKFVNGLNTESENIMKTIMEKLESLNNI